MEYTILILLLPFLSFLALGLGGKWMSHRTAGLIGTAALSVVAVLSYLTAGMYFSAPRLADGTYEALMPYNFKWLPFTESLSIDMGILLDPISVMMLVVISYRFAAGTHILFRLHEGRTRFPALLRLPVALHHVHARTGSGYEYLPDVSFLGVGGRVLLSADWFLLYETGSYCRFEESIYRYPFC